jgi:hypothetical protein
MTDPARRSKFERELDSDLQNERPRSHDNRSLKRINAEPLTFEDRTCHGRNRSESL